MPIFESALQAANLTVNSTVDSHRNKLHSCWFPIFPDKNFANYRAFAKQDTDALLTAWGMWGEEHFEKLWSTFPAVAAAAAAGGVAIPAAAAKRQQFIDAVEVRLQAALTALYPPPPPVPLANFAALKLAGSVTFPVASLEAKATAADKTKVCAIHARGTGYRGHGPTTSPFNGLGLANVLHAHVGNGTGLAFKWVGNTLHIHGLGQKSGAAGAGTSGYAWTTA
jgi:hypothetical protein